MARLHKIGKVYYVDVKVDGKWVRRSLGLTNRAAAEAARTRIELAVGQGKNPFAQSFIHLSEFLESYLAYCASLNTPHTVNVKRIYSERFVAFFGKISLERITKADVEAYLAHRLRVAGAPTVNRELATLRHAFNLALERGILERNPTNKVKLLPETKRPIKILSDDEIDRCFEWCEVNDTLLYDLIVVALNTGLRRGDLLKLRGEDIDVYRRTLTVIVSKRRGEQVLYLPLNQDAFGVLSRRKRKAGNGFIFPGRFGSQLQEFKRRFAKLKRVVGINFRFMDLRHNCAVRLLDAGADLRTVQTILGHSNITTTADYYLPVMEKMQRRFLEKISQNRRKNNVKYPPEAFTSIRTKH